MNEWRPVGRPATLAQVEGDIPDVHVIAVRERRVTVDYPTIIQNNINTDTVELDLDGEWDDMSVVLVLGPCGRATELAWHGEPLTLPSALAEDTGGIDVSVVGYSADGDTRLVTVAAPSLLNVIKSGCTVGEAPGDETPDLIGQLVAAGDAANKAAQSANAAATSASKAASAANTAASAANAAAGKANTAATKATDAATKATAAAGEATRAAQSANAAAEAAGAAAEAARGNVLKGTLGPAPVLSADDAYATKPRRLTVYGNTRQNLWANPSGTQNGVTVTSNADGSLTVAGSATQRATINLRSYALRAGSSYTVSSDKKMSNSWTAGQAESGAGFGVVYRNSSAASQGQTLFGYGNELTKSLNVPSTAAYVEFYVIVEEGVTVSGTYRVMLNEGSEPEPWCPPGINGVDELSVVTAGKNLLARMGPSLPHTMAGITFSDNGDSGIRVSGTATAAAYYNFFSVSPAWALRITPGEYTASLIGGVSGLNLFVEYYDGVIGGSHTSWLATKVPGVSNTGSIDRPVYLRPFLSVAKGKTVDTVVYPQLELGSTATAYEPPQITTTPIDLQGHMLNSLPDGTRDELRIDGTGAVTLVQRVGVATAPTAGDGIASFTLPAKSTGTQTDMTELMRCDKLPVRKVAGEASYAMVGTTQGHAKNPAITSAATAATVAGGATYLYPLATPQTIPLTAVTLPTLPSPNITVYNDSDVPSDITLEYERDVTIAFDKLQAQVSATTVREATNG